MLTDEQIDKFEQTILIAVDQMRIGLASKDEEQAKRFVATGEGKVYMLGEDNTPQLLKLVEHIRTLQQQNKQMKEALEYIRDLDDQSFEEDYFEMQRVAEHVINSLQGGSSNDTGTN